MSILSGLLLALTTGRADGRRQASENQDRPEESARRRTTDAIANSLVPINAASPTTERRAEAPSEMNGDSPKSVEEKIFLAKKPAGLPECEAAPGLLAFIWLSKYSDHLPLYRLETITQRHGISFSRSTTCDWMMRSADTLRPLWQWMCDEVRRSRVVQTDDTTVPLQDPETGLKSEARFWNYIGDDEHRLTALA